MSALPFPHRAARAHARARLLSHYSLLGLIVWLASATAHAAAAPRRPHAPARRTTSRHKTARGVRHARARKERDTHAERDAGERAGRFDVPGAGEEFDGGEGEEIERREEWFMFQRAYPFETPPAEGRRRAWEARRRMKDEGVGVLPLSLQQSWQPIGPAPTTSAFANNWGLTSGRINAVAVSPANPQVVLVGAATGGIWRSTDAGQTFTPVSDAQVDLAVGAIAFSRSNPAIVYAGMGDLYNAYLGTGVLKSTDAGQTWTRVSNATLPAPATTAKLEVDPTNPNRVFVVQYTQYGPTCLNSQCAGGVYVSNDGGVNWTRTFTGLVRDLAFKPGAPGTLYIGVRRADAPSVGLPGLYKSLDGGANWTFVYVSPLGPYTNTTRIDVRIAVTPAAPDTVYIFTGNTLSPSGTLRVEVSNDGGLTWTNRGANGIDPGQFGYNAYLYADPTNPQILYAATRDVYKSFDGGLSWANLTNNFVASGSGYSYNPFGSRSHPDQHSFAFAPDNPATIYIGNDGGLAKSTDGGLSFQSMNATLALSQFVGIAMHPADASRTYGGTQDNGTQARAAAGTGWREFAEGDGGHPVVNAADPSVVFSTYIYAAIRWWRFNPDGTRTETTSRRTSAASFGEPTTNPRIAFYPPFTGNGVDSTLYFGTYRLMVSTTYANPSVTPTWFAPGGTTDLTRGGTDVLSAIGVEPRAGAQVIYTGSELGRVMRTTNGGQTWTDVTAGLPNRYISSIVVEPGNSAVAYLTVSGYDSAHVFKTTNQGATWTNISGNLPNIPANDILPDPSTPTTLYVATDVGVFRTLDGGQAWASFNQGLPPAPVTDLAAAGGRIQLGTYGRGAYELTTTVANDGLQFSAAAYTAGEGATNATVQITRGGDAQTAATVNFATVDDPAAVPCSDTVNNHGAAYARCDYETSIETVTFAPGETGKTVSIPLIDDAYAEGAETVQLLLANANGATLGPQAAATLTINDNDAPGAPNPIFTTPFFVRQHYLDFLAREPEAGEPWSNVLNNCSDVNNNPSCDRLTVSGAFFGSPEFLTKGVYTIVFYRATFGRLPAYAEFAQDLRSVTGATPAETNAKRAAFAVNFTQRPEFTSQYGALSNAAYVSALLGRYSLTQLTTPDPANPDGTQKVTLTNAQLTNALNAGTLTRAQVLRAVVQSDEVSQ
ncbi:MAG TPA: Calx-beta domain-containing protein, partial [Pyrinomonadaceae bacterium]